MQIAITGGCGYIGSVLIPKLQKLADQLDVLDLVPPQPELMAQVDPAKCSFHQLDVSESEQFRPLAGKYDYIIHLAGLVGYPICDKHPDLAVRYNVETTRTILETRRPDTGVFYSSTCSNYGAQESSEVDETFTVHPTSWHGKTKVRAEKLVLEHDNNIVYRFVSAFGCSAHTRSDLLIHDFVRQALSGKTLSVYESSFVRQFVHVQDMTDSICFALENWKQMQGQVYNIGNPAIELTKQELVKEIAKLHDFEYRFENSGTDMEKRNYAVSFDKIMKLGFSARVDLHTGLKELIEYFKSNQVRDSKGAPPPSLST